MADPLLEALGGALVYATVFYAKNRVKEGSEFDPIRFASTLVAGVLVGVLTIEAGVPLSQGSVAEGLAAHAGLIAVVDASLSAALDGRLGDECYNGKHARTTDTGLDRVRPDGGGEEFVWGNER